MKSLRIFTSICSLVACLAIGLRYQGQSVLWRPVQAQTPQGAGKSGSQAQTTAPGTSGQPAGSEDSAAQGKPATTKSAPANANHIMKQMRLRLMAEPRPVSVRMMQLARVNDRREVIRSHYVQHGPQYSRLTVEMSFLKSHARLLQVCDGERLWTERRMVPQQADSDLQTITASPAEDFKPVMEVRRRQLSSLRRAAEESAQTMDSPKVCQLICGGLPSMLASLERSFDWTISETSLINERPATVLRGDWSEASLLSLEPSSSHKSMLFSYFRPHHVEFAFDTSTRLPIRLIYFDTKSEDDQDQEFQPVFAIEFHEWQFDQALSPETFTYRIPNGVVPVDETHECLSHLR